MALKGSQRHSGTVKMTILGVTGSPRKNSNTGELVKAVLKGAENLGAETVSWSVEGKTISGCTSCFSCLGSGVCAVKDGIQELYPLLKKADGVVFGSPVYFWGISSQLKTVLDRMFCLWALGAMKGKAGAGVVTTCTRGATQALQTLTSFFIQLGMHPAGFATGYCSSSETGSLAASKFSSDAIAPDDDPWAQAEACAHEITDLLKRTGTP